MVKTYKSFVAELSTKKLVQYGQASAKSSDAEYAKSRAAGERPWENKKAGRREAGQSLARKKLEKRHGITSDEDYGSKSKEAAKVRKSVSKHLGLTSARHQYGRGANEYDERSKLSHDQIHKNLTSDGWKKKGQGYHKKGTTHNHRLHISPNGHATIGHSVANHKYIHFRPNRY